MNFVSAAAALDALRRLNGTVLCGSTLGLEWSASVQGLAALVAKYRNSSLMHVAVADHYKPALYHDGTRLPFPSPTVELMAPTPQGRPQFRAEGSDS